MLAALRSAETRDETIVTWDERAALRAWATGNECRLSARRKRKRERERERERPKRSRCALALFV